MFMQLVALPVAGGDQFVIDSCCQPMAVKSKFVKQGVQKAGLHFSFFTVYVNEHVAFSIKKRMKNCLLSSGFPFMKRGGNRGGYEQASPVEGLRASLAA